MHSLTHSHSKRSNLPSRSAIKKALERELDNIKSSLGDNEEQINLEKLISMYSDLLVVEKRGEEVPLMRSEEYRAIVDSTTIVSKTDATGAIVYVNDKFCGVSGYEVPELLGKSHSIIRHPEESKKTYLELWQTISKKRIWRGRIRNKAKSGKTYWQDAVIIPQID
jgi:PAS domain S-box-containing protein